MRILRVRLRTLVVLVICADRFRKIPTGDNSQLSQVSVPSQYAAVNIGELKNQLSAYLQFVRNGEEVIIRDRNTPVARILPIQANSLSEQEATLVASGAMTLPQEEMDWDAFFAEPAGDVPHDIAVQAAIAGRGDR